MVKDYIESNYVDKYAVADNEYYLGYRYDVDEMHRQLCSNIPFEEMTERQQAFVTWYHGLHAAGTYSLFH